MRLIDADALIEDVSKNSESYFADDFAKEWVDKQPTIEPMRKKGRWVSADTIFGGVPFYCSECGENTRDTVMGKPRWNFCPACGADMREPE